MSERPLICMSGEHWGSPVPAVDKWESADAGPFYYCRACSVKAGIYLPKHGYHWEPLPDIFQVQPTSERVEP